KIDSSIQKIQTLKLENLIQKRDNTKAAGCLAQIKECAQSNRNLMPAVISAVENYCTLGEVANILRSVFGEYK
ncbi:MAG: methylmalonyl-CoA mutase family protein, partial [Ferruginibacter sp.]